MEHPLGSAGPPRSVQRSELALVAGATLLATVLSGWGIGAKSLWRDERYTVSTALRPWGSLVDLSVESETNGFVHAFALRAFSEIGTTEGALRALSALCFVATVPMVWLVARRLVNRRAAIIATFLVATHGGLLAFGQTARAYAMVVLVASVVSWLFLLDIEEPRRWKVVTWAGAGVVLAGLSVQAFLLLPAHLLASRWLEPKRRLSRRRLSWGALSAALAAPIAVASVVQNRDVYFRAGLEGVRDVAGVLSGGAEWAGVVAYVGLSVAIVALVITERRGNSRLPWGVTFALHWLLLPILVLLVLSTVAPIFFGRYVIFTVPALAVLAGAGADLAISSWRAPALWRVSAATVVVSGALSGPVAWLGEGDTENWRSAADLLFAEGEAEDAVLFSNDTTRLFFEYYRHQAGDPSPPEPFWPDDPWGEYDTRDRLYQAPPPSAAEAAGRASSTVWLVQGLDDLGREDLPAAREALLRTHRVTMVVDVGQIVVERYQAR